MKKIFFISISLCTLNFNGIHTSQSSCNYSQKRDANFSAFQNVEEYKKMNLENYEKKLLLSQITTENKKFFLQATAITDIIIDQKIIKEALNRYQALKSQHKNQKHSSSPTKEIKHYESSSTQDKLKEIEGYLLMTQLVDSTTKKASDSYKKKSQSIIDKKLSYDQMCQKVIDSRRHAINIITFLQQQEHTACCYPITNNEIVA